MRSSPLQSGIELRVTLQLIDVNTCEPLSNVMTEFWHCNNLGIYSGFEAEGTEGQDFLRGMQMSDEDGIVQIVTNFPGWYAGRATHIHIATHLNGTLIPSDTSDLDNPASGAGQYYTGGTTPHIGQVYFDEGFLELIDVAEPYTENTGPARLKNDEDNIFRGSGADAGIMTVTLIDGELGDVTKGLVGSSIVGIDTSKEYDVGVDRPTGPAGTGTAGNGTVVPPTGTKNVEQDTATDGGSTETGTGTGGTSSVKNAVSVPWMLASSVGAVLGYWMLR